MVKYYISNNSMVATEHAVDEAYREMTEAERDFWLQYPYATIEEVLQQTLLYEDERQLNAAKRNKAQEIAVEEEELRSAGYYDDTTGLRLFLRESDAIRYTQFKTLHLNCDPTDIVEIGTYAGWVPLTWEVALSLLDRYGRFAEELYQIYSKKNIAVQYATTVEQVEAI